MNMYESIAAMASTFLAAVVGTGVIRRFAPALGLMDRPSLRSSHQVPTARGGGLAIALPILALATAIAVRGGTGSAVSTGLVVGGAMVATVGWLDDRRSLRAGIRFSVHLGAAALVVVLLGFGSLRRLGAAYGIAGWSFATLAIVAIVWSINLFNFMDGIDGIAAVEAIFVSWAGAGLNCYTGGSSGLTLLMVCLGCACAGFLVWNWPPARIFMGDVGSGFLGFLLAAVGLVASCENPREFAPWVILAGVFLADATVTLCRRVVRGERWHEAHRSHAYQRLARRWRSHRTVTLLTCAINIGWLLPCAAAAAIYPQHAWALMAVSLAPLVVVTWLFGAGKP